MGVIDFFDRGWAAAADAVAYCTSDESWTYNRAGLMSCRVAHALIDAGAVKETPIAVLSPNSPLSWITVLGIWRAGAAWVPLNPASPAADNADLIERFDVAILFYDSSLGADIAVIRAACPRVLLVAFDDSTVDPSLHTWVAQASDRRLDLAQDPNDVAVIGPTGGTTGTPKGVMNTHRSLAAMVVHQMLAIAYDNDEPIVNLAAAPMTHTAGLMTLQTSARGGTVVIIPRASPNLVLDAVAKFGVTDMFLPPTVIYRLLDALDDRDHDTSTLRYLLYGAAPMSMEKLRIGIERLGSVFIEIYGQYEACAGIAFLRPSEHFVDGAIATDDRLSACGRPYPLVRVEILDSTTGESVPTGRTGEICVRGDLVMKGYYKDPERTAETLRDGWLHTGDLGHLDAEGYLHVTDRIKDMIITGGFNVYPGEVEQVIWSHPAVQDCAVVGSPDDDWGERVTAVVELNPGQSVEADELIALCRKRLGGIRTPKLVLFVDSLPRSVNGKVLKKDVRESFWSTSARSI
nr:AMP-binding protein [uncultured Rhodococcus sp.]